jgi:hypothetical protein
MFKKSLKNTILLNIGAFLLVLILEVLSMWAIKDKFDTNYSFFLHGLNYAIAIMAVIWINHFVLIPYFFDKKRYFLYGLLLIGSIFLGAYLKIYAKVSWPGVIKMVYFLIYTT